MQVDPSTTFDQVGGLDHYVSALKEMVFLPLVYPGIVLGLYCLVSKLWTGNCFCDSRTPSLKTCLNVIIHGHCFPYVKCPILRLIMYKQCICALKEHQLTCRPNSGGTPLDASIQWAESAGPCAELFDRFHLTPPRGVLFYGPPGPLLYFGIKHDNHYHPDYLMYSSFLLALYVHLW